jgi:Mg2+/Co2+ transporter CorC
MAEAGTLLSVGDKVPFNGHVFTVEKVNKRRITQVRMESTDQARMETAEA